MVSVQRYIDTGLWLDDWFVALPTPDKLLYVYLLTNPQTNIAGIYKTTIRIMHNETGLNLEDIEAILAGFAQDGKAHFRHGRMILPAWPDHQRWQSKKTIKEGIDKVLDSLPAEVLETLSVVGYRYPSPKIPVRYPYAKGTVPLSPGIASYDPSYSDTDSDTDTDSELVAYPSDTLVDNLCTDKDPRKCQMEEALAGIRAGMRSEGEGGTEW